MPAPYRLVKASLLISIFFSPLSYADVNIEIKNNYRYISSNGLPEHETGQFPNQHNPNTLSKQQYEFRVPVSPEYTNQVFSNDAYLFGVALDGIPFDPGTAEFWQNDRRSGWNYEALSGFINLGMDMNNAHVQPNGAYHYHGIPLELLNQAIDAPQLIGYAADGFPIYNNVGYSDSLDIQSHIKILRPSFQLKTGTRSSGPGGQYDGRFVQDYTYVKGAGDLDECNGRFGKLPEYPQGTYYYVLTDQFPFVPRCFKGQPDPSFLKQRARGMPNDHEHPHHRHPPPPRDGERTPPPRR